MFKVKKPYSYAARVESDMQREGKELFQGEGGRGWSKRSSKCKKCCKVQLFKGFRNTWKAEILCKDKVILG